MTRRPLGPARFIRTPATLPIHMSQRGLDLCMALGFFFGLLGLAILATAVGIATYFLVSVMWKLSVLWKRHRRRR